MTHDELLGRIKYKVESCNRQDIDSTGWSALRAVVELHKPITNWAGTFCKECGITADYPCPTIQAIEAELK